MKSAKTDDGGHAFPSPGVILPHGTQQGAYEGMSLRDYFAAQAMAAVAGVWKGAIGDIKREDLHRTAEISYAFADAMLKVR